MSERVVLITGGNGSLGAAIARSFLAEQDAFVWLGIHVRHEKADALAGEFPGHCECLKLDVTQAQSWSEAVARILSRHSRLDVLVNNAGKHADSLLAMMPP